MRVKKKPIICNAYQASVTMMIKGKRANPGDWIIGDDVVPDNVVRYFYSCEDGSEIPDGNSYTVYGDRK